MKLHHFPPNNMYAWVFPYEKFQRHETKLASLTANALSSTYQQILLSANSKYQMKLKSSLSNKTVKQTLVGGKKAVIGLST